MTCSHRVFFILALMLFLVGCGGSGKGKSASASEAQPARQEFVVYDEGSDNTTVSETDPTTAGADKQGNSTESLQEANQEIHSTETETIASDLPKDFKLEEVPAYTGNAYIVLNDNRPFFSTSDIMNHSYESYSALDSLGRCGPAKACVGLDTMPTEERGSIGQVKPTGWQTVKYDIVDGKYLYNRCHLIGYQLTAENANTSNLITGTRYLNTQGMLPFENMVADYVKETGNHVEYHVTPIFEGQNLLAKGVLMEGYSVEDQGDGICFCVFAYNSQPGIEIDYATGDSQMIESSIQAPTESFQSPSSNGGDVGNTAPTSAAESQNEPEEVVETKPQGAAYILNTNTKKFHYPSCSSVDSMKESNKREFTGSREEVLGQGYAPCKRCNP